MFTVTCFLFSSSSHFTIYNYQYTSTSLVFLCIFFYSLFPVSYYLFFSLFPTLYFLLPIHYSLFTIHYFLFPILHFLFPMSSLSTPTFIISPPKSFSASHNHHCYPLPHFCFFPCFLVVHSHVILHNSPSFWQARNFRGLFAGTPSGFIPIPPSHQSKPGIKSARNLHFHRRCG